MVGDAAHSRGRALAVPLTLCCSIAFSSLLSPKFCRSVVRACAGMVVGRESCVRVAALCCVGV